MAKAKQPGSVPNRPLYSRLSYLYQAASYLAGTAESATPPASAPEEHDGKPENPSGCEENSSGQKIRRAVSRRLLHDMRATSLKGLIRLSPAMKRTVCKYCDTLMIEGETCTSVVENMSKGGKKPWADVLATTCKTCGGVKRFPIAPRQKRRPARKQATQETQPDTAEGSPEM
ncbi:putative Rpr2-domain-containing protein [Seiridium unicorne]|uniref:Rpr2-domain-containing protein n=1 Tax=Seiridium unicorne TaxID=138068 RepID=A0ABR2UI96_9PEZI